jgi:FkbM family methyltransferase
MGNDKTFTFGSIKLTVDESDRSALLYDAKSSYEELNSMLYPELSRRFNPDVVIDIGANYGFISLVSNKFFPNAQIVAVEPCSKLCGYIEKNFSQNGMTNFHLIDAICAEESGVNRSFSLNPAGSQDNRVIGENESWQSIQSKTISMSRITEEYHGNFYFIKIDTQGYEQLVFEGGEAFMESASNWAIKTEFAPYWLKSQGTDPVAFLEYLVSRYDVAELPVRFGFKEDFLGTFAKRKIAFSEIADFVNHIQRNNKTARGWCDLMVLPKSFSTRADGVG